MYTVYDQNEFYSVWQCKVGNLFVSSEEQDDDHVGTFYINTNIIFSHT